MKKTIVFVAVVLAGFLVGRAETDPRIVGSNDRQGDCPGKWEGGTAFVNVHQNGQCV